MYTSISLVFTLIFFNVHLFITIFYRIQVIWSTDSWQIFCWVFESFPSFDQLIELFKVDH